MKIFLPLIAITAVALFSLSSCQFIDQLKAAKDKIASQLEQQNQPKTRKKEINPEFLITCEGIGHVKLDDTHKSLVEKFGEQNVEEHENNQLGTFTSIWYEDEKQINVYWKEKKRPFKTIKYLEVVNSNAPYMTKDSLMMGLGIRDLVKVNGGLAITFNNVYQTKNPGLITSFHGGRISQNTPCIVAVLELATMHTVEKQEFIKFRNTTEVNSYDNLLNRVDFELSAIRLLNP